MASYPYTSRPDDELAFLARGGFERGKNRLQNWVLPDSEHPPAADRYHIFLNYSCGWSHQCLIARALKGLQDVISVSHTFQRKRLLAPEPTGNGFDTLRDAYNANNAGYGDQQVTVPLLFDKVAKRAVSNDPAHILLMLNEAFDDWATNPTLDLYPASQREKIEEVNAVVWPGVNDGFYRCFLARDDAIWAASYEALWAALEYVDGLLTQHDYLCGSELTLADVRILPHLYRMELIYLPLIGSHVPSSIDGAAVAARKLSPTIVRYVQRLLELPGVGATCDPHLALHGYYAGLGRIHGYSATMAELDGLYEGRKQEWMLSIAELEKKRVTENLPATVAEHALKG